MPVEIPQILKDEHAELMRLLNASTRKTGATGKAGRKLAGTLRPHFEKEEEFALPILGALSELASGTLKRKERKRVVKLHRRFKTEHATMLREHKKVHAALKKLKQAATAEGNADIVEFADMLDHHASLEEILLYPAALVAGELTLERQSSGARRTGRTRK